MRFSVHNTGGFLHDCSADCRLFHFKESRCWGIRISVEKSCGVAGRFCIVPGADACGYTGWKYAAGYSYSEDELREEGLFGHTYLPFSMQRPVLFDLIKGKKTPVFFKFTLFLSPLNFYERTQLPPDPSDAISGFLLNLRFMHGELTASTGVSYRTFSTDKSLEHEWDRLVEIFLKNHNIVIEKLG